MNEATRRPIKPKVFRTDNEGWAVKHSIVDLSRGFATVTNAGFNTQQAAVNFALRQNERLQ